MGTARRIVLVMLGAMLVVSCGIGTVDARMAIKTDLISGKIVEISGRNITLNNGETYLVIPSVGNLSGYSSGEAVTLRYYQKASGKSICVEIAPGIGTLKEKAAPEVTRPGPHK